MLSQAEENYLKTVFNIDLSNAKKVSTTLIAKNLKTKASSVTDMIKKLAEKNLVYYEKYKGVSLTAEGKQSAVKIVRRHRLWEVFLVDKLHYKWHEVHDLAEQLEHINSNSLIDKLDEFLEFPSHDPHGDPIPDKNGNIEHHKNVMLSSVAIGETCTVLGVKDSSVEFLNYLDNSNIQLGNIFKIISKEPFDNSIIIENNKFSKSISNQISKNLYVKIL